MWENISPRKDSAIAARSLVPAAVLHPKRKHDHPYFLHLRDGNEPQNLQIHA